MNKYFKLNDICDISGGYAFKSTSFRECGIPIIRIGDISDNKINISETTAYINENIEKYKKFIISKGDILIALSGATTGKFGIYDYDEPALLNQRVAKLFPKKDVLNKYLYHYMNKLQDIIYNKALGCAQPNISPREIGELEIYLPNISEQKKIVEILDKAQILIYKRKEQIKYLDELVKSKFIEMFGEPIKNTKGWNKVKLSALGEWKTGGTPSRNNSDYFKGNIPWLSSGELNNKYCFGSNEHITEEAIKNSSAKLIEKESLLLGMYDTAALKSTINMVECTCNQAIAYSKLNNAIANTVYVYYCIQMGKDFYKSQQRGVRQKNLNLTMIKDLEIIMPPLELQNNFIDFIKQIDKLKFEMEKSLKELEDNFNSLMEKAFNEELLK